MCRKNTVVLFSIPAVLVIFAIALIWVHLWIQLNTLWPPEHVHVDAVSPDGRKMALFSVKYQGLTSWLPTDVEPHYYVTIVDTQRGTVLLRESEYHGDLKSSFNELAKKYAPWAVDAITSNAWGP